MTNGLHESEMIVIAARPSMGKTALAMNIAEHVAINEKLPVAVFSLEMSSQQLVQRLLCSRARVNLQKVRDGFLAERDFPSLTAAASKLAEAQIFIDDSAGLSILELRAKARRLKAQKDIKLIVVDYLQLLRSTTRRAQDNRQLEISEISAGLKGLAKELKIPIIVIAQLNRQPEARTGGKPRLSDLRESGSIEQDADLVGLARQAGNLRGRRRCPRGEGRRSGADHREAAQRPGGRDRADVPEGVHALRRSRAERERAACSSGAAPCVAPAISDTTRASHSDAATGLERLRCFHDVRGVDPEFFHHLVAGRAHAEAMQADHLSIEADILIPEMGHTGFDRDATPAGRGNTSSRYSADCRSKRSKQGIETTRVPSPSSPAAFSACCNSLPHDSRMRSSFPLSRFAM